MKDCSCIFSEFIKTIMGFGKEIEELKRLNKALKKKNKRQRQKNNGDKVWRYQQLKDYMLINHVSLTSICVRNDVNVPKHLEYWYSLKKDRISLCHPVTEPIKSDADFLRIICLAYEASSSPDYTD